MKQKGKAIASSIMAIAMSASLAVSGTFALFTSESEVNIAVTSGTVDVVATVNAESLKTYSMGVLQDAGKFENGGTAGFNDESQLELSLMTPGDKAEFTVDIANNSNVAIQYKVTFGVSGELADALVCSATNANDTWIYAEAGKAIDSVDVSVELPETVGNDYQNVTDTVITVKVEAVQGNAPDEWDGTTNIDWFLADPTADTYELSTAEDLAGLAAIVDAGDYDGLKKLIGETGAAPANAEATIPEDFVGTFEGTTFKLNRHVDFSGSNYAPIGDNRTGAAFKGTFDGQNHIVSNIGITGDSNFNGNVYGSKEGWGLFSVTQGATIKNLTVENANFNSYTVITGAVVGYAHNTTFENVTVANAQISTYNWYSGGVAGWVSGETSFKGVTVDAETSVGTLWGSYDTPSGGLVGGVSSSAKVSIEDCTIACVIDAVNDACSNYQWFAYRYTGMLIGNIDATQKIDGTTYPDPSNIVTCKNVTVIYGDWVNYHYCESESYGTPSYADEGEWKFNRVEASDYATDGIDITKCNHDADETHNEILVFDQLFGGGQGVYGLKTYDGVTVIYNNK